MLYIKIMNSASDSVTNHRSEHKVTWVAYFWFIALITCLETAEWLFLRYEMPVWLRVTMALVSVVPFAGFANAHWRVVTRGDELARHMARETYVVAFYVLLGAFLFVRTLKAGGILTDFTWKTGSLLYAMMGSMLTADVWTRWRYR